MSLDTGRRFRPRSRSPSQAHNEVIEAPPATRLARDLARAESAIWAWRAGLALSLHPRGWVAFRRMEAMASASSSCPAATLITRS